MCIMALTAFIYTIAVNIYAFCLAFSGKKYCILHHFTLRFAAKRTAFSTKTHCVLRHIALRLAPNCTAFSSKQPQNRCKWRFY